MPLLHIALALITSILIASLSAMAVVLPESGETLGVCVLTSENRAAVILSDDLIPRLKLESSYCLTEETPSLFEDGALYDVLGCGAPGEPCLGVSRFLCDLCGFFATTGSYGRFLLYRQVGDGPFEEIGLMNDDPACVVAMQGGYPVSHVSSAPIYLVHFSSGGIFLKWPDTLKLRGTLRLVWADPRPLVAGEKARYRIFTFDSQGNPKQIHTSHWLFASGL